MLATERSERSNTVRELLDLLAGDASGERLAQVLVTARSAGLRIIRIISGLT